MLLEEAADIVQYYLMRKREQDMCSAAGYDVMQKPRRRRSRSYQYDGYGGYSGYGGYGDTKFYGHDTRPERGVAQQLGLFSKTCLPPSRSRRLCSRLGVTVGLFHRTTFEIDGQCGFIVEQQSQLHSNRPGATIEGGVTEGLDPGAHVTIGNQLPGRTYSRVSGRDHIKLVLEKMRYHRSVRWWLLFMLLTETVWVDAASKADALLPSSMRRQEGAGLRLDKPMLALFFEVVGGTVFKVGTELYFKVFSAATTAKKVERIEEGGSVRIGDQEISRILGGSYWELGTLEIGLNMNYRS